MNRIVLLITLTLLVVPLTANSVGRFSATAVSFSQSGSFDRMSVSGPSLFLDGGGRDYINYIVTVGDKISLMTEFAPEGPVIATGSIFFDSSNISGPAVGSVGAGSAEQQYVVTPDLVGCCTFPSRALGEFMVTSQFGCGQGHSAPCGVTADVSIDLPGKLILVLAPFQIPGDPRPYYRVSTGFVSTPVPEPATLGVGLAGFALILALGRYWTSSQE
jgi:hypothetical protein